MLLIYHDPQIHKHLENNSVIPEMYCIPWFITYFAARMASADLVLEFWDRIMLHKAEGDVTFIFFFAVALVMHNRDMILKADQADLPQTMTELKVKDKEQLSKLIKLAGEIEENTPFSYKQLDEVKGLFSKQSPENLKAICLSLESL